MFAEVDCVTEVACESLKGFGTGYLIAPDLVLTALHVIMDPIKELPPQDIKIRTIAQLKSGIEFQPAKLIWPPSAKFLKLLEIDIALLEIRPDAATHAAARRIQLGTEGLNYGRKFQVYFTGFPRFKEIERTGSRDTKQVYGEAAPASSVKRNLLEITVDDTEANPDHGWEGASGAAVFAEGRIVAVLRFRTKGGGVSFEAARLDVALSDGEFRARCARSWSDPPIPLPEQGSFPDPQPGSRPGTVPSRRGKFQDGAQLRFIGGLPIVLPENRRKLWHENIVMRAVVDRTALAAVTVGASADDLLASCMSAESLLENAAPHIFGQRQWLVLSPGQGLPVGRAHGIIWPIEPGDEVSIGQLEDLVRAIQPEDGEEDVGSVLIVALSDNLENKARVYLDSLAEIADRLGCRAALQGWSTAAYAAFAGSLSRNECAQPAPPSARRGEESELIRLLRASRSMDHRAAALREIRARSGFLTMGLRRLCDWAYAAEPVGSLEELLSRADVDDFRVADLAGLFIEAPQSPTSGDDKRAHAIVRAARLNPDLRMALIGLPVSAEVIEALVASDSNVRVAVGLLTRSELAAVPAPWSGCPVSVWRRGRDLVRQPALRQKRRLR